MAGGLRYTRVSGSGSLNGGSYHDIVGQFPEIFAEEFTRAGEDGRDEATKKVEMEGTNREWSGAFKDRDGSFRTGSDASRENSGDMKDALDYRIIHGQGIGLDVGWVRIWEKYFGAQDVGFSAPGYRRARQAVTGMGVIAHLRVFMRDRVDEAMDRGVRRVFNGL